MHDPRDEPDRPAATAEPDQLAVPAVTRIERSLAASLSLTVIPVVVLVLAALGAFVYGAAVFVDSVVQIARHPFPVGHHIGLFLLDIDLFLIGATLLISAVAFYELFIRAIHGNGGSGMPAWLHTRDLNDLKARVISMIIMVLAVGFVELALDSQDGLEVLELGSGVALVIAALTAFLWLTGRMAGK